MERSKYAEYFEKEPLGTGAQCKLCVATIALSSRSGTSGMRRHLQRHHKEEFQEMLIMESKMETGTRKRERESSTHEEDSFTKQMKMIEDLVYNCSQMTDDSMVQGEVKSVFDENRIEEDSLAQLLQPEYIPTPSAPPPCEILPDVSPSCSTSCQNIVHQLQMSLLYKMNQIEEAETKASSFRDRELLAQSMAEGAEARANILEAELKAKDELLERLQEELKARDRLLEEEQKRHSELMEEAKRSHAEKDGLVRQRMEELVHKKEELSMQLNTHMAESRTMKFERQRTINELQAKVVDLAAMLKKYEELPKNNGV